MEENKKSPTQAAMLYGLILGIVVILFSLVMFLLDVDRESPINYIVYLFMIIVLYLAMINFRDQQLGGIASYGQMFGLGFKTILFGTIISAIFTYFFVTVIDPGMIDEILMNSEEKMLDNEDLTDEQIDQALLFTERFVANPIAITIWAAAFNLIVGTVLSLIISIFVKREDGSPA
jgi:hypothetical protein